MCKRPILTFRSVSKTYTRMGRPTRPVLDDLTFSLPEGSKIAVVGRSGSGKSTLLNLAAGIDLPTRGAISLWNRELSQLPDRERTLLRRDHVGLIFQFFYLLPHLSLRENIALPALIAGERPSALSERMDYLLDQVGLLDRANDPVDTLSGGEMQRIAVCRALLRRPALVLADEPTGNLDDSSALTVIRLLFDLVDQEGSTLVLATHSREIAQRADQIWEIHSGHLEREQLK